jgi:hypothetical protein
MSYRLLLLAGMLLSAGSLLDGLSHPVATATADNCGNWCRDKNTFKHCPSGRCYRTFHLTCDRCVGWSNNCDKSDGASPFGCQKNGVIGLTEYTCQGPMCDCGSLTWVEDNAVTGTLWPQWNVDKYKCNGGWGQSNDNVPVPGLPEGVVVG